MKKIEQKILDPVTEQVPEAMPGQMNGDFDDFVLQLALKADSRLDPEDTDAVRTSFLNYVNNTIKEYEHLCDIAQAMEKNPRVRKFIELLLHGESPEEAVSEAGLEDVFMDSLKEKEYAELTEEQRREMEDRYTEEIREFYLSKNVDNETITNFVVFAENFISDIYHKNIGKDLLEPIWKAFSYDNDIKSAYENGVVAGRNEKIEALRKERNNSDGIGMISGGAVTAPKSSYVGYIERIMSRR